MGRLPKGVRTLHMHKSNGADTNMMKFYVTQNSTTYGRYWQNFKPREGKHTGTGYSSNFRPGVYYSQRLDDLDNPTMSRICANNYMTVTDRDFRGYHENTGAEVLPMSTNHPESGFSRLNPITYPTEQEAKSVFIDSRVASAPASILPHGKPLLHKIKRKDVVESENHGYGPSYMVTETKERYKVPQPAPLYSHGIGPLTDSGFTHNHNIEPVTYEPGYVYKNEKPGWDTHRPTGVSIMKTTFLPLEHPQGGETFPKLSSGATYDTGFTREKAKPLYVNRVPGDAYDHAGDMPSLRLEHTRKSDPCEYINLQHPDNHSSVAKNTYQGKQNPDLTEAGRLGRSTAGGPEDTGFTRNGDKYYNTSDDPRRFTTHYMTRFLDDTPIGLDREGHCRGGLLDQKPDGFTKSTLVHSLGTEVNTTETLRRLEPYVARSIKARDVFYDDHQYDGKSRRVTMSTAVY